MGLIPPYVCTFFSFSLLAEDPELPLVVSVWLKEVCALPWTGELSRVAVAGPPPQNKQQWTGGSWRDGEATGGPVSGGPALLLVNAGQDWWVSWQACEDHQRSARRTWRELLYLELSENSDATHSSEEQQWPWPTASLPWCIQAPRGLLMPLQRRHFFTWNSQEDSFYVCTLQCSDLTDQRQVTDKQTCLTVALFSADVKKHPLSWRPCAVAISDRAASVPRWNLLFQIFNLPIRKQCRSNNAAFSKMCFAFFFKLVTW